MARHRHRAARLLGGSVVVATVAMVGLAWGLGGWPSGLVTLFVAALWGLFGLIVMERRAVILGGRGCVRCATSEWFPFTGRSLQWAG